MASTLYEKAVADARQHHLSEKTYSGRFLRPHKIYLSPLIERLGIRSALDYGAGKGQQYSWIDPADGMTLEQAWGFEVRKFDPCWPPYEAEPVGAFDLVICTHALGSIPMVDQPWVLDRLFTLATKAVFIAEKIGPIKKRVHGDRKGFINDWSVENWRDHLEKRIMAYRQMHPGPFPEVHLSTLERLPEGKIVRRFVLS